MARTAKPKEYKCVICGRTVNAVERILIGGKSYCQTCVKDLKKESDAYKDLCVYICENMYGGSENCNMPFISRQLKILKDEYSFTNQGMLMTLQYVYEVSENHPDDLDPQYGATNILLRYYQEARKFYETQLALNKKIDKIERALTMPPNEIVVKRSDIQKREIREEEERRKRQYKFEYSDEDIQDDESQDIDFLKEFNLTSFDELNNGLGKEDYREIRNKKLNSQGNYKHKRLLGGN